jgi:subtilisin family serine protease
VPLLRRLPVAAVIALVLATNPVTTGATAGAQPPDKPPACSDTLPDLRYLVLFEPGTAQASARRSVGAACGTLTGYYPQIGVAVASSPDSRFPNRIGSGRAFSAERVMRSQQGPHKADETDAAQAQLTSDPATVSTVDLTGEQWDMSMINADRSRRIDAGSRDVVVGVLDSGVDPAHPDLRAALDPALSAGCLSGIPDTTRKAWVPTASAHGTHVAGTIAAADDGRGVAGVAPGVRIASVKVVDDDGFIFPEYAVCGLMWASVNDMAVTNNSYFVDPWLMTCNRDSERVVYEAVRRAVDYATDQGTLTVAAATNESTDLSDPSGQTADGPADVSGMDRRTLDSSCKVLPAGLRGVIAVSAVGSDEVKAGYSSYGLGVIDVTAPGGEARSPDRPAPKPECVLSTVPGGYDRYCGTSMATPHVTGVAALLAGEHPEASPPELSRMLNSQAEPVPCPDDYDLDDTGAQDAYCDGYAPYNGFYGHGMVDAEAAVTDDVSGSGSAESSAPGVSGTETGVR